MSSSLLIAIRRTVHGLDIVESDFDGSCKLNFIPLADHSYRLTPQGKKLLASWNSLIYVDLNDPKVVSSVLDILANTVPSDEDPDSLRSLESMVSERRTPVATAAHPRAYQGTKKKLPKQPVPETTVDLRPYLMSGRSIREVLKCFSRNANVDATKDPYLAKFHADSPLASTFELPPTFRLFLLPLLEHSDWRTISRFLKLYWDLNLVAETQLIAFVSRYLKVCGPTDAHIMMSELSSVPAEFRQVLSNISIELMEAGTNVVLEPGDLQRVFDNSLPGHFIENTKFTLECRAKGLSTDYIDIAISIHRRFFPLMSSYGRGLWVPFWVTNPKLAASSFPVKEVFDCMNRQLNLDPNDKLFRERPWWGLGILLWGHFAEIPKLAEVFREVPWRELHPAIAQAYALLICHAADGFTSKDQESPKRIEILTAHHERITKFLLQPGNTDYKKSFLCDIDRMPDAMEHLLPEVFPQFLDLLERISKTPFPLESYLSTLLYGLLASAPLSHRKLIGQMENEALMRLSKSCLRYNEICLASAGLASLISIAPDLVTLALISFHRKLLKVGKLLGSLNLKLRHEVLQKFKRHPINRIALSPSDLDVSVMHLKQIYSFGFADQFPKKLKHYFSGEITLSPAQLTKAIEVAASKMDLVKLELLEHLSYQSAAPALDIGAINGSAKYALQMVQFNSNDKNVRAFRKFLFRYLNGETDYVIKHPRNAHWLASRTHLNLKPWLEGFERSFSFADGRKPLRLRIEINPLEALKMGSIVGTCTGLGGQYSFSALGAVLDINKRVVYAVNSNGAVVGRQLIGITKDNCLFRQDIYPQSAYDHLRTQFEIFARGLASEIGIKTYEGTKSSGEVIEFLVAEHTYDADHIGTL